ncbi:MAG: hypothetical protein KY469_21205 [Actinobacteria bacterium]|nr:hypothetical protein [Actinomycetota bacterium]
MTRAVLIVAVAVLLAACGGTSEPTARDTSPAQDGSPTSSSEAAFTGSLGGDAQLEGGCAWLETETEGRVEPRWPDGYRVAFEPVRLLGPDGEVVAEEGDTVTVRGAIAGDVMTICQVGPVLRVTQVEGS